MRSAEDRLYAMRLDELYGLYAEAKRQTGFLRPCSQAYARAVAAIWRIGEAIAWKEAMMHILIPPPCEATVPVE